MSSPSDFQAPFADFLGIKLTHVSPERVEAELAVRHELATVPDILHGGAVMALADNLGGVATVVNLPKGARTATIESKTNFFAAIPGRRDRPRRVHGAASRPHHHGVADQNHAQRRQALRAGDPDANRHSRRRRVRKRKGRASCRRVLPRRRRAEARAADRAASQARRGLDARSGWPLAIAGRPPR